MPDKIKIVMIDDEEDLCFVVKANLEDSGEFDVITVSNPEEAEGIVEKENPDLVLLDNIMPGRKGADIAVELKNKDKTLPIIMVSGKGEMVFNKKKEEFKWMPNNPLAKARGDLPDIKSSDALAESYGVEDYISKPFTTELLVDVIKEVLAKSRKRRQIEEQGDGGEPA